MSRNSRQQHRLFLPVAMTAILLGGAASHGEPTERLAEVVGADVYVRSGPSLNHYTVMKLQAGDRVTVLGEAGEWYKILPPEGTFSLISGDYVDTADDKTGVVNGSNVRVRCGSTLNKNKYTVQTKLSKGAEVRIISRNKDGFLRITPPSGVAVWINRGFVELVSDELVALEREVSDAAAERPAASIDASDVSPPSTGAPDRSTDEPARDPFAALSVLPPTPQRAELERLDAAAQAEVAKPLFERRFDSLIDRYDALVAQDDDRFAKRYAETRVAQLRSLASLTMSAERLRRLGERAESERRKALADRASMTVVHPEVPVALDAQGELRTSALYPPGPGPRRFRLVDPDSEPTRTIGYVEIPVGSPIDAAKYVGRYVGVRASRQMLQPGGVRSVPVYIASELVVLPRPEPANAKVDTE